MYTLYSSLYQIFLKSTTILSIYFGIFFKSSFTHVPFPLRMQVFFYLLPNVHMYIVQSPLKAQRAGGRSGHHASLRIRGGGTIYVAKSAPNQPVNMFKINLNHSKKFRTCGKILYLPLTYLGGGLEKIKEDKKGLQRDYKGVDWLIDRYFRINPTFDHTLRKNYA